MATDDTLENSSFTDVVVPFITDNGMGVTSTCSDTITGYTLSNTQFTFTPIITALQGTYIGASLDKMIWDFGDGTQTTGYSVQKHYKYPGSYDVNIILTDQNGITHKNRLAQKIIVYNYIPDSLTWYTPTIADSSGGLPEKTIAGKHSDDLSIYRYNSWQSWPAVSGDGGYNINLYSQGSQSRPLTPEQYWASADVHYIPSWRFVESKSSTEPIVKTRTSNDMIYVKVQGSDIVHTNSSDAGSIFAGTTGIGTVNYIDDNSNRLTSNTTAGNSSSSSASYKDDTKSAEEEAQHTTGNENRNIILYASFDTSKFPVTREDDAMERYSVFRDNYFQLYETQKIGLPIQVKFNCPTTLSITSNGIQSFNINKNKYLNSPFAFNVRTADDSGDIICTDVIVPLSSRWTAPSFAFSANDVTTDVLTAQGFVTTYLSGTDSEFYKVTEEISSAEDFEVWDAGTVLSQPRSSFIKILLTDQSGALTGRVVTLLMTALNSEQIDYILRTPLKLLQPGPEAKSRVWKLKNGIEYTGYISPRSCYGDVKYVDLIEHDPNTGQPTGTVHKIVVPVEGFYRKGNRFNSVFGKDSYSEYTKWLKTSTTLPDEWHIIDESENRVTIYGRLDNDRLYTSVDTDIIDDAVSTNTYGTYAGYMNAQSTWTSLSADNKHSIYAQVLIDPPLYFNYDVTYYYLCNPSNDYFHQVKPVYYRQYSYGTDGFTQTYTPPVSTISPGNSGMYGFAVEPEGSVIMVDGDSDKIIRHWRNRTHRAEIPIHTLFNSSVSSNHYPGDPDEYGYSPSSVSLDKNLDYWVTLYDAVSTVKIDGNTNQIIACAAVPVENYLVDVRTTSQVAGIQGEYGENLVQPTSVETCRNNDIVVTYSNTLCSFIARYDTDGKFLHKYELPGEDRYFTGAVCIDVSDHTWAVTDSTGLNYDGSVSMDPPKGVIYSFDESMDIRLTVDTLTGTSFQDMIKPVPVVGESYDLEFSLAEKFVEDVNTGGTYVPYAWYENTMGKSDVNPKLTLYEGNTYNFKNLYYSSGAHQMEFREIVSADQSKKLTDDPSTFNWTGDTYTSSVTGVGSDTLSISVTTNTPSALLVIDANLTNARFVIETKKKEVIGSRTAESFTSINNPSHVITDNSNNIWFSWDKRFCSRYNVRDNVVDTTVAVGSAFYEPRYHPLSAATYDRRDNADRRSSIEGLGMDTGNNLLVVNNLDKRIYALNSDTPTVSAYVNINTYQTPYSGYTWVESISSENTVEESDFINQGTKLSYLTDEQIKVFLSNTGYNGTQQEKLEALATYQATSGGDNGDVTFRKSHGAPGVHDVGFESELRAGGDWTGWHWINKYDDRVVQSDETSGFVSISGYSNEFELIPEVGKYDINKTNEDIDFAEVLRQYILQPGLKDQHVFYNTFLNAVFGTEGSSPTSIGKSIYEKISNYVSNHNDIDVCTLDALHSMATMVNYKLDKLDVTLPADIKRVVDILSVSFSRLKGTVTNYQEDFEKYGNWSSNSVGLNLGSEILFIFDYNADTGYGSNDYVYHNGRYYESIQSVPMNTQPVHEESSEFWRYWPDGLIRARHIDDINSVYRGKPKSWRDEKYIRQTILTKLVQQYKIESGKPVVLREYFSEKYNKVTPMMINFPEHREYSVTVNNGAYSFTDPNRRNRSQYVATNDYTEPVFDINDAGVMTLMGGSTNRNPTLTLLRNRTYKFHVDSPGHQFYITTTPGASGEPLAGYVTNQGTDSGEIIFKTDDESIYENLPDILYYQSKSTPEMNGVIELRRVSDLMDYSTQWNGVTAYNISISFSGHSDFDSLGWGASFPEGDNVWQYYSLYEYIPQGNVDQEHIGNLIDWDSLGTTVNYDVSNPEWSSRGGVMDIIIEKTLRQGLGLFDGLESLTIYSTGSDVNNINPAVQSTPNTSTIVGGNTFT